MPRNRGITVIGLEKAERDVLSYTDHRNDDVKNVIARTSLAVQSDAKRNLKADGTVDEGRLRASLRDTVKDKGFVREVEADAGYAVHVEYGTAPHTPPLDAIVEWAERKGLGAQAGRAIWAFIRKFGTKPHPFLEPAAKSNENKFLRDMRAAMRRTR